MPKRTITQRVLDRELLLQKPVWDLYEAAFFLCVHPNTMRRLAGTEVRGAKLANGEWRFLRDSVLTWVRGTSAGDIGPSKEPQTSVVPA